MCAFCSHCGLFRVKFHECYQPVSKREMGKVYGKVMVSCYQKPFYTKTKLIETTMSKWEYDSLEPYKKDGTWRDIDTENIPSSLKDEMERYFFDHDCLLDDDERCVFQMERRLASWNE